MACQFCEDDPNQLKLFEPMAKRKGSKMANGKGKEPVIQIRVTVTLTGDAATHFMALKKEEFLEKDAELGGKLIRESLARRKGKLARTG
jgi:hypothetical protein